MIQITRSIIPYHITIQLLYRQLIQLLRMEKESKLVFFLKKMGKESHQTSQRQKTIQKIGGKLDRITKEQQNHYLGQINSKNNDSTHILKRITLKNQHLYRSLQSNAGVSQSERTNIQQPPKFIPNNSIKRYQLQSIDQHHRTERSKEKLTPMPISTYKFKEKCNKKIIKIDNSEAESVKNTLDSSQNINTYLQFKHFMSKGSNQSQNTSNFENKKHQNKGLIVKNKKCIFRKQQSTRKQLNQSNNRPYLNQFYEYMNGKKTKMQLQKTLFVQSKKHQLTSHMIFRDKVNSRFHKQLKTLHNQSTNLYKEIKDNNDRQLEEVDQVLKLEINYQKSSHSSKNQKLHKIKNPKNVSLFYSKSQSGVYQQKIKSYRQLLFLINVAHKVFDPLVVIDPIVVKQQKYNIFRPTYYIGGGNNSMLVRSLMKRRIWWDQVKQYKNANFVWTQLKISSIFMGQKSNQNRIYEQFQSQSLINESKQDQSNTFTRKLKGQKNQKDQLSADKLFALQKCNDSSLQQKKQVNTVTLYGKVPKGLIFKAPFAVENEQKILTQKDSKYYKRIVEKGSKAQLQSFESRLKYFPKDYLHVKAVNDEIHMHNHFEFNHSLGNKKSLFYHMQFYYKLTSTSITKAFPITFHIRQGQSDPQFHTFLQEYQRIAKQQKYLKNIWILKPGQNSNRGSGITVIKQLKTLKKLLRGKEKHRNGQNKTFILQKYIERPLLYKGRKFDIRHYMIISGIHGRIRAYWYGEGYIRTSSYMFKLQEVNDPMIHLTNDAIQKECQDYGCFEEGNKISYNQLQKYFNKELPQKHFNYNDIFCKMRELAKDAVCATYVSIDPNNRLHNFQIFGLDFMIDQDMNVMLIEVNINPCLELSCNLLGRIIPMMLQQSLRVALDPIFPPPTHYTNNTKHLAPDCSLEKLQMELMFDSGRDAESLTKIYQNNKEEYEKMMNLLQGSQKQVDEVFDNQGVQIEIDNLIV